MPLAGKVFEKYSISRAKPPACSISDHNFHLPTREENHILAARCIVPIFETAVGPAREDNAGRGQAFRLLNSRREQVQILKMGLAIIAAITSDKRHWFSSWLPRSVGTSIGLHVKCSGINGCGRWGPPLFSAAAIRRDCRQEVLSFFPSRCRGNSRFQKLIRPVLYTNLHALLAGRRYRTRVGFRLRKR